MKSLSSSSPSPYKKIALSVLGVLVVAGIIAAAYVYLGHGTIFGWSANPGPSQSHPDTKPPTKEQTQAGNTLKTDIVNEDRAAQGKPPIPGTNSSSSSTTTNAQLDVTITAANQNGSVVNIRSLISTVTSNGTCTLTLTKDTSTVTKTAGIQPLANASTCKGFDIPTSELSQGTWHISLTISSGSKTGTASGNVVVN